VSRSSARFLVSGRVQGVGYRAWTRRQAMELGLQGLARNLDDGRVEVLAAGTPEALDTLDERLRRGPALARVDAVQRESVAASAWDGFHTA
jgi:acylphosphatase